MSTTIVDMPKVCQMLDAGWTVRMFKNQMGSYSANADHESQKAISDANKKLAAIMVANGFSPSQVYEILEEDMIETDDFTPEQALTRLAYKVHGEII